MVESFSAISRTTPPLPQAELLIEANGVTSIRLLEAESYRVGRASSTEISYPQAAELSREHLAIERQGNQWLVRDLGSTNGSKVNGERITQPRILRSGDRITAGQLTMIYRESGAAAA